MAMGKIAPTRKNLILFALLFQLFPTTLSLWAHTLNRNSLPLGHFGIFVLAEFVLVLACLTWIRRWKPNVLDEEEAALRLRINSFVGYVVQVAFVITTLLHLAVFRHMPALLALLLVGIPALLAEVYANLLFRRT